jgi:hypothetical protein
MLRCLDVEFLSLPSNCIAVSSVYTDPFSNVCSTQADNSSRKLRLRVSLVWSLWQPPTLNQTLADRCGPRKLRWPLIRELLAITYLQHASRQSQSSNHPLLSNGSVNKPAPNIQPTIEDVPVKYSHQSRGIRTQE